MVESPKTRTRNPSTSTLCVDSPCESHSKCDVPLDRLHAVGEGLDDVGVTQAAADSSLCDLKKRKIRMFKVGPTAGINRDVRLQRVGMGGGE